jgi:uncharacterized protein YcfJ
MEMNQTSKRMHPLIAGAAASVILVSLLGAAAITGILPNSNSTPAPALAAAVPAVQLTDTRMTTAPVAAPAQYVATAPAQSAAPEHVVHHKHVVIHQAKQVRTQPAVYAQAAPSQQAAAAPVYQQPAPVAQKNSPVGIGVGAVVGGLIGSQVGGGNGRTLATIAGAVGGGYIGNEIAKRTP